MSPRVLRTSSSALRNRSRRRRASYQPWLERLEDRTLLTFGPPTPFDTAPRPADVAVGDFNNDNILDLITANSTPSNSVSVLLGNGDGTFQPAQTFAAGPNTIHVALGDINNDGQLDVVTANFGAGTATLLWGNGDGTLQGAGTITFSTAGAFVSNVALADLNADDNLDLIATITNGTGINRVGVALGSGQGAFQTPVDYAADFFPQEVIVADYNGDGILDLAVAESGRNVRRFTGNGDGTFQPGIAFTTSSPSPLAMAAADFNGDDLLDLVVHDQFGPTVGILAGNPNGTFQFPRFADARTASSNDVLAGDINGDGLADIITVNRTSDNISLLLGNGNFTFRTARLFPVAPGAPGARPNGAALGDFNGDGLPDLAVANQVFDQVAIFLNDPAAVASLRIAAPADATAGAAFSITVSAVTTAGAVATDYRGTVRFASNDPSATLPANYTFTAADAGERTFTVTLRSPGSRTITVTDTAEGSVAGIAPVAVTAPLTASRLVVTGFPSPTLAGAVEVFRVTAVDTLGNPVPGYLGTVRFTSSDGQALLPLNYTFTAADAGSRFFGAVLRTAGPQSIAVTDIATASITGAQTGILVNPGPASRLDFSAPAVVLVDVPFNVTVTARDSFNNVAAGYRGTVQFTASDPLATLPASYTYTAADAGARTFAVTLRTPGGQAVAARDIAAPSISGGADLTGIRPSPFYPPVSYAVAVNPYEVVTADFNGDGLLDLATANGSNSVSVLLGNGDGTFQPRVNYPTGQFTLALAVGDFNGDGLPDLAASNLRDDNVSILLGNGDGTFQPRVNYPTGPGPRGIAAGDLNGDGLLDLVVASDTVSGPWRVSVLLGNGDGSFQPPATYAAGQNPDVVALGDFDEDGQLDFVVTQVNANRVGVFLGNGDGTFRPRVDYPTGANGPIAVTAADLNGDGALDLAVPNFSSHNVGVLLGNGDGTFRPAVVFPVGLSPRDVKAADFNLDGWLDLAVTNFNAPGVSILYGDGAGGFLPAVNLNAGSSPYFLTPGDFDGNGYPDLAVSNLHSASVAVLLNATKPASVLSDFVNDSSSQRSQVTSLTVVFSGIVSFQPNPFAVLRPDGSSVDLSVAITALGGRTAAVISFTGDDILGGSLADGNYTLVIHGDRVRDHLDRALDGDGDGTPGGDRVEAFFRLFGDTDGDRDVDEDDQTLFDAAFGTSAGDPGYLAYLDFDADGIIDETDRLAFTARLGSRLDP